MQQVPTRGWVMGRLACADRDGVAVKPKPPLVDAPLPTPVDVRFASF